MKPSATTSSHGFFETQGRRHDVPLPFEQCAPGDEQLLIVGDVKDALGHKCAKRHRHYQLHCHSPHAPRCANGEDP